MKRSPLDDARLATRYRRAELDAAAAAQIQQIVADTRDDPATEPRQHELISVFDADLLRGIPMMAKGVGGTIRGTQP